MKNLTKPSFSLNEIFSSCIVEIKSKDLKLRLKECLDDMIIAEQEFEKLAKISCLFTFEDNLCDIRRVSKKEMKNVYSNQMVPKNKPGRNIYDKILSAPFNRTCPICGQRKVSQLDHFLPKTFYPSFVITPINLIPSCAECNKKKLDKLPVSSETETLHPYFDNLGAERFLFSSITNTTIGIINFEIIPPKSWSELTSLRVKNHFESFDLNLLYSIHAIDDIIGQADYWIDLDEESLKDELKKQAKSRIKSNPNSWQSAFYEGMSESVWFCQGGYKFFLEKE